jgi:hypothetical protein
MVGGSDAISVEGLPGQLLEAQGIRDHAQTHEALGTDRLNVDGLHGQLYNVQKPDVHDNSAHDPNYSINKHGAVDHNADVEAVSRKGTANGYAGLGANGYVPKTQLGLSIQGVVDTDALRHNQSWGPTNPEVHGDTKHDATVASLGLNGLVPIAELAPVPQGGANTKYLKGDQSWADVAAVAHKTTHEDGGADEISMAGLAGRSASAQRPEVLTERFTDTTILGTDPETSIGLVPIPEDWKTYHGIFEYVAHGHIIAVNSANQVLEFKWYFGGTNWMTIPLAIPLAHQTEFVLRCKFFANDGFHYACHMVLERDTPPSGNKAISIASIYNLALSAGTQNFDTEVLWTNSLVGSSVHLDAGCFINLSAKDS